MQTLIPYAVARGPAAPFSDAVLETLASHPYQTAVVLGLDGWVLVILSWLVISVLLLARRAAGARAERMLASVLEMVPDPMGIARLEGGTFVRVSEGFTDELGYSRSDLIGKSPREIGLWGRHSDETTFSSILRETGKVHRFETQLLARDDSPRNVQVSARTIGSGRGGYVVLLVKEVGEHNVSLAERAHHALHDPLTELPNPALLIDRLANALAQAERRDTKVAVLSLNIDRFRVINHNFGHRAGDQLLTEVADRLKNCLREEDTVARAGSMAARIGADEFTVVLGGISTLEDAEIVLERIEQQLDAPFLIDGREVSITAAIGVVLSDGGRVHADDLLRRVGIAMRRAKSEGPGRHHVFDVTVDALEADRLQLENDLREAVSRGELELRFQPIVSLDSGTVSGMETLVRWRHPTLGLLSPMEFIPIAEESGLIHAVGQYVLREACRQAHDWHERFADRPPLVVAVNMSAEELHDPGFYETLSNILLETGLNPAHLQLEITESLLVQSSAGLQNLKRLDVRLAIDDFGVGYSSLKYLARLPVDAVKIDRSFISELGRDPEASAIVEAMVTVANTLQLEVTAEGIETEEQLAEVNGLACAYGQGYLFARPLPIEEADALLAGSPRWPEATRTTAAPQSLTQRTRSAS